MDKYLIKSEFQVGSRLPYFDEDTVKNEPMFFSAKPKFAWKEGGPITRAFLAAAFNISLADVAEFKLRNSQAGNYCFDSRVHMLMPGWFPCIPGWHHDDVPRSGPEGQPNYSSPEYKSKHILALINGDIAPTEFAVGTVEMPHVEGDIVYKVWHEIVEQDIADGVLKRVSIPSNRLIYFDCNSFHQGVKAIGRGWRWFGRLSWDAGYEQGRPHFNEIRKQVNVYMEAPMQGW